MEAPPVMSCEDEHFRTQILLIINKNLIWILLKLFFQDLDHYLQDKVYLAGNRFTLADIFMYYGVHPLMVRCFFSGSSFCDTVINC